MPSIARNPSCQMLQFMGRASAIEAAEEIGEDTAHAVRDVLVKSVKGAKDVITSPMK